MISDYDKANIGRIIAGQGDWFSAELLRLIAKADLENRNKLHQVYPEHVEAYLKWVEQL